MPLAIRQFRGYLAAQETHMSKGVVVIEANGESFMVPVAELANYQIPVAEIVPAVLNSMGISSEGLNSTDLDEALTSWKNPVVAYLPEQPK